MRDEYRDNSCLLYTSYSLRIVTTIVLGVMLFLNTKDFVEHGYGNYASADVNIFGWGCILFVVIFADFLTTLKGKEGYADLDKISQKEVAKK